jgi:hypothetical protein
LIPNSRSGNSEIQALIEPLGPMIHRPQSILKTLQLESLPRPEIGLVDEQDIPKKEPTFLLTRKDLRRLRYLEFETNKSIR